MPGLADLVTSLRTRRAERRRAAPQLTVLRRCTWQIHHGGAGDNQRGGGITGQLTEIEIDGAVCYVRENLGGIEHFMMSANQRLSMKWGRVPKGAHEVLELVTPEGVDWQAAAEAVRRTDAKGRPVRTHPRFTISWARDQLARAAQRVDPNAQGPAPAPPPPRPRRKKRPPPRPGQGFLADT